jgi:hypothetical protein
MNFHIPSMLHYPPTPHLMLLCDFLQPPVPSIVFGPDMLLGTLISIYVILLMQDTNFHIEIKQQVKFFSYAAYLDS